MAGQLTTLCVAAGPVGEHEICGGPGNGCEPGLGCVNRDQTIAPHCLAYCEPNDESGCDENELCEPLVEGDDRIGVCVRIECSLYPNDSCPALHDCYRTPNGRTCLEYDTSAQVGDMCSTSSDCNASQECLAEDGTVTELCRAKCIVGETDGCPPDEQCVEVFDGAHGACMPAE